MTDYIDREKLIKAIPRPKQEQTISLIGAVADMFCIINAAPKEDVAPVVHAEWRNNINGYPECTNCGYMPAYDTAMDDIYYSPYCPNCGAKMADGSRA